MAAQGITCLGLSPGTVATEMQVLIKASGINPGQPARQSRDHIPASDVARSESPFSVGRLVLISRVKIFISNHQNRGLSSD